MGRAVGGSTLDEVEGDELPEGVELDDLTPVEDVARELRGLFKGFPKFDDRFLVGEVGDLSTHSEHLYFTLNAASADAALHCVVWESKRGDLGVDVSAEMVVAVRGELSYFQRGGRPTLEVETAHLVGESAYWQRIQGLRNRLDDEGLFDDDRKRPLPRFPRTVGVVTAAGSDAEQDVVESVHGRYPDVDVLLHDSSVQGADAPAELAAAIRAVDESAADVLVVARGGGSETSLRTFNEERVVRAVAAAETPTVAAIGHDADEPLTDDVADVRAKTPTAAGEAVVVEQADYRERIETATERIGQAYATQVTRWVEDERDAVERAFARLTTEWIDDRRTAVVGASEALVADWTATAERDVRSAYADIATGWVDGQRTAVRRETTRIEREHSFEREKSGLERRNTLLVVLVAVLLVALLVALAVLFGII